MRTLDGDFFGEALTADLRSHIGLAYHHVHRADEKSGRRAKTVMLYLRSAAGEVQTVSIKRNSTLGAAQEEICGRFKKEFPCTKVLLVIKNVLYTAFSDKPFRRCRAGDEVCVLFALTNDLFFFDQGRCRPLPDPAEIHVIRI